MKPEPEPVVCPYCGTEYRWEKREIPELGFTTWIRPQPCMCAEAVKAREEEARRQKIQEERQRKLEQEQRYQTLLKNSGLPARYHKMSFETAQGLVDDKALQVVRKYAEEFIAKRGHNKGLFITGSVGTGKTGLAASLMHVLMRAGIPCIFGSVVKLLGRIKQTYGEDCVDEQQVINDLCTVPLLVVDDLGKEKVSPWVQQVLFEVIDTRYSELRPFVVTTNFTLTELEKRYEEEVGVALASRIAEFCIFVGLKGPDLRKSG